ncbi:hypothetical protein PFLUV_G00055560 [Perca fluviatilis]|uniref:LEM domain-containing protein n=2 Tax=Perca fluviatilis TaxID=8168 RepID=A0A6A5FIQ0_PERFL|nr:hypothetical protein PFLUV_G00055560 [Perca fluviatilis]
MPYSFRRGTQEREKEMLGKEHSPLLPALGGCITQFVENPAHLSKFRLKSDLVAHDVALPPSKSKKEVYVGLHLQHIGQKNAVDFSSDEEDQVQDVSDKEEDTEMPDPSGLTDDDLKAALLELGVKAGPIVASTRALYEKKLRKLLQSNGHGCLNGVEKGVLYSDSEEEEENGEEEDKELGSEGEKEETVKQSDQAQQGSSQLTQEPVKDTFKDMFPNTDATTTGIYATRRRPIKGAAGRPVQYAYPDTPVSPTTLEKREVERRLVPIQIQILVFLIVMCLLYLIYVCVEDNSFGPSVALLDSLYQGSDIGTGLHTVTVNEFRLSQETTTMTDSGPKFKIFKCLKIIISSFLITVLLLFTIASIRTLSLDVNVGLQLARWEKTNNISLVIDHHQREELLAHFKEAIRIPTVSFSEKESNTTALREFDRLLRKAFPTIFSSSLVRHELVANYSHLFSVQGSQPDLVPYLLLAHIDVVPASESDGWEAPPFSAKEIDGFIYGRGTIDDKSPLMGILQALEYLLIKGYAPRRGFYIGLGHDEEVSGYKGAMNIVRVLKQRSVQLSFVLDEGLAVLDGVISGLEGPAALIGISEKGSATVKLSVSMLPGHSSMPPSESSIGILAAAVKRLEENPMPRLFGHGPERGTFEHLAHKFGLPMKFIMSNLWLFAPLMGRVLERKPDTNAFVRTTTAVTMFNAGVKVNIIPALAEAYVNLRIHSAQSLQEVLDLIQSAVGDQRVKMELVNGFDPLPVSSADEKSFGFQIIKKTVLDIFPTVTVAPGICIGNTDSRHFKDLTNDIYRFAPVWFKPGDAQRFHGINERISKKNYEELIEFYFSLIQNCDIQKLPEPHSSVHEL